MPETTYQLNDIAKLSATFTVSGVDTDPTTVTVTVRDPTGTVTTYTTSNGVTKDATGQYHLNLTVGVSGRWAYKWSGTGTAVDNEQGVFYVIPDWTVANPQFYITPDELKATLSISGQSFADTDISARIMSASRAIDELCQRRFWQDAADVTRYYTPETTRLFEIDDLSSITSFATDDDGSRTFATTWTKNTDFILEPINAPVEVPAWPWTHIRVLPQGAHLLQNFYPDSAQVVGKFGWPTVPDAIVDATGMLATRLLRISREAPFGVVSFDGGAVRIARMDSTIRSLIQPYRKHAISVG